MTRGSFRRLVGFVIQRSGENHITQIAGSLTFTTMLSLVPLLTVAFALFSAFPLFSTFQDSLQKMLVQRLVPAQINEQIFHYLNQFAEQARRLTAAGLIALVVVSVTTLMTVESAFNVIWRVPKSRPFAQRVLVYWAVITLGPVIFGVSLSISSYLLSYPMSLSPWVKWALTGTALPLTALAFAALYVYLPNCHVKWRDAMAGGILAALVFECTKRSFGLYLRQMPTYTAVYGAFATVPIFLLWVYLSWLITLYGAVVVAILPTVRVRQFHRPTFAGSDLFDALQLLARLAQARERGEQGAGLDKLMDALRRDTETIARLLAKLEARGWIARLESSTDDAVRWVLLANLQQLTVNELFDLFVIEPHELARQSLSSSLIDGPALLATLNNDRLTIPLADLLKTGTAQISSESAKSS